MTINIEALKYQNADLADVHPSDSPRRAITIKHEVTLGEDQEMGNNAPGSFIADHYSTTRMLFAPQPHKPNTILVLKIIHKWPMGKPFPR